MNILRTRKVNRKGQPGVWLCFMLLYAIVFSVFGISRIRRFKSHVVEPEAYESVATGMTKDQVLGALGEPTVIKSERKDRVIWRYQEPGVWEFVEIEFGEEGKVKSKFRDS